MFNVFSKAFLDNKNLSKNASATSNAFLKNPSAAFMSKGISETAGGENEKTKMSLKERLASVRNVQNIMAKKKLETEETGKTNVTANAEATNKEKPISDFKKPTGNEALLPRFKNYSAIVNERNNEKQKDEEMEKKLKKRKRRKKHEILMERMKQQGKGNYGNTEENNNDEDDEEEHANNVSTEESMKRRGPGRPSKNKQQEKRRQEEDEEEEEEEDKSNNQMRKQYDSFRNNDNSGNNRNSNISNGVGEPVKQKRRRRKKKEMEALRAQGLIGKKLNNQNNFNRNDSGANGSNTGFPGQEENKVKRRRGRPKLSGNKQNNSTTDNKHKNDDVKGMDIRRYCSKNDDNESTSANGTIARNVSSNHVKRDDEKMKEPLERGGDKPRNIFNIITSSRENDGFMKKTPNEIEQLEKNYKHNVQTGVTCIPLNYQENGGGLSIIFMDTNTQYGPVKNYNGFMTFLVLDCDSEQFFLETGITNNVIECEKHMQLLISPGDTYTFKNKSHELEAKLLLIACNKMTEALDLKRHIRDPTMNQERG